MTIKEVSEKYGITQDTLRYYERVGMIPPCNPYRWGDTELSGERSPVGGTCQVYAQRRAPSGSND